MKKLYIIREINLIVLILLIQEYTPKVQKVLPRINTIQFLHTYIKVGYMHQKKLSLTAVELHFLQLNFTFLPLNFTSYN